MYECIYVYKIICICNDGIWNASVASDKKKQITTTSMKILFEA